MADEGADEGAAGDRMAVRRVPVAAGILAAVLVLGLVWVAVREVRSPGDYLGFVGFGRAALEGRLPYAAGLEAALRPDLQGPWATWPPAFAPLAAGLALVDRFSRPLGILLVQFAGLAGLAGTLAFFARRAGVPGDGVRAGARVGRAATGGRAAGAVGLLLSAPVLLALAVPYRVLLDSLQNTQVNLLVLGLIAGAFALFGVGRRWAGGLVLGAATAFKAVPLVLLGYLAWRGKWKEAGAAAIGVAAWWVALPRLVLGPGGGSAAASGAGAAGARVVGDLVGSDAAWLQHALAGPLLARGSNQSLLAVILRIGPRGSAADLAPFGAAALGMALLALAAFGRPFRPVGPRREAAELAAVLVAMSLLSPLSWVAHYVSLAPLVLVLAAGVREGRERAGVGGGAEPVGEPKAAGPAGVPWRTLLLFALAFVALDLTGRDLVGSRVSAAAEMWGAVTWAGLALFLLALWELAHAPPRAAAPGGPGGR